MRPDVVSLAEKFRLFDEHWKPKIIGEINDAYVKVVKLKGEFVPHRHKNEDELFLVVKGTLRIRTSDGDVRLDPGEFVIIPKGLKHQPVAEEEVHAVLIEPKTTLNTGDTRNERTVAKLERI